MRAAVFEAIDQPLAVEDVAPEDPGPKDVVVRITASGLCHSDLSVMNGVLPVPPPTILGHEGAGVVDWVGAEVDRVQPGDRVIGAFISSCGSCWFCINDQANLCEQMPLLASSMRAVRPGGEKLRAMAGLGTFAEAMTVDQSSVVRVDSDLPDEYLALIGCGVTTGVGAALNTARVEPGSTVAVVGCGGVGQAVVQGARIAGAAQIIAIDPVAMKREVALKLGATDVIDPAGAPVLEQVRAITAGRGVDYSFEAIGDPAAIRQAFDLARAGGTCTIVGLPRDAEVPISIAGLIMREKRLLGSLYGSANVRRDFPRLVRLVEQGQLKLGDMVSRRIRLQNVNDGFDAMRAGEVIRSVIVH